MKLIFQDLQQLNNPMNGTNLKSVAEISSLFKSFNEREPFFFELRGENGLMLTIGLASTSACVQFSCSDGQEPYLMALNNEAFDDDEFIEFLAGGTPTPISRKFCVSLNTIENIVNDFFLDGEKSKTVVWVEVGQMD